MPPVTVSRAGYLAYYANRKRRKRRLGDNYDPGLVPEGNWTALSAALLSEQSQGGFRIQTAADDAFGMAQKSYAGFIVGATYRVEATVDIVSSSTTATLRVSTAAINNTGSLIDDAETVDANWEHVFVASATTLYFGVAVSRAAFSADATVSGFTINWEPIDLNGLSLSDLLATAEEEWSATISGNTSGSTITATSSDGATLTVDGTTVSGTFATAGTKTVSLEEEHPNARAPRTTNFSVTVEAAPEAPAISAPLDVTWVEGTNPPEFFRNVDWVPPGDVQVGDVPKIQFNGTGTIYEGDPVAVVGGSDTFPTMPTLDPGAYTAVLWYDRDEGGPGEVLGTHSDPSPEFTIEAEEFTLEGLFANGEKGALYDFSDLSTLFQTEDTSMPVTADGQAIGRVNDKSGNGNHIVQATSGSRPSYETDGSLHWIEGYSDFLASAASVDLSDGPVLTIILGLADADRGTGAYIQVNNGADALASPGAEILRAFADPSPQVQSTIMGNVGSNNRTGINSLAAGDDWDRFVLTSVYDFSQAAEDEVQEAANGSSLGSATGTNNNTNTSFGTNRVISLFGRNAGELSIYATRCYGALIINRALTPEETTAAEAAIADLAGVTL